MENLICGKYEIIGELENQGTNYKSILSNLKVILKEIKPKDKEEYNIRLKNLEYLKSLNEIKIYDIIKEDGAIYVAIENDPNASKIFDLLFNQEEVKKEGNTLNKNLPISKKEIFNLFKMEKAICKIHFLNSTNEEGTGTGFFCEIDDKSIPIEKALFTNYHVLNKSNLEEKYIRIDIIKNISDDNNNNDVVYFTNNFIYEPKQIYINDGRKIFYNEDLDYTCIELNDNDGLSTFFQIDKQFLDNRGENCLKKEIIILQYPLGQELSFSMGKIIGLKKEGIDHDIIKHNASTKPGSSGSPIIRRSDLNNNIIGIHYGALPNQNSDKENHNAIFNVANFLI